MSFNAELENYGWEDIQLAIRAKTTSQVKQALHAQKCSADDLMALLSPAAQPMLEELARAAHGLTVQRFGRVIQMYAPIYVSSQCANSCVYCGFSCENHIARATLSPDQVVQEGRFLHREGFRHVLLVSGESHRHLSPDDLGRIAAKLRAVFASVSIEVYPLDSATYSMLIDKGVDGLTIYQETYHRERYAQVHPAGPKRNFNWRLETADRGGQAGFRRLNIGALLGLSDWRVEGAMLGFHAAYLMQRYWKSHVSVSFPRLRPAAGGYQPRFPVADRHMVQLMCALRLYLPDAGLVLSTREPSELRNNLIPLGVTQMSAGSKTAPGCYTVEQEAESQFEVCDHRTPREVAQVIAHNGYEPVWKDWDAAFLTD